MSAPLQVPTAEHATTEETPAGRRSSAAPLAPPGDRPDPAGVTDSQLAVLLRQTQWALDAAAHDFPAGRVTPRRREELAETLEGLAVIVRASVPPTETPAGRRLSDPRAPAPGGQPDPTPSGRHGEDGAEVSVDRDAPRPPWAHRPWCAPDCGFPPGGGQPEPEAST